MENRHQAPDRDQDTALLSTFEPVTSIIIGYFVLSEPLTARNIAGIICILLSVVLLSTEKSADTAGKKS